MDEEDVLNIISHPSVNFITDGLLGGKPHPRSYGTLFPYPRRFRLRYERILSVEEAVRKMTSLPAEKLRLRNKGKIVENGDADITIFNSDTIIDHATYENPEQFPTGIEWVIVNGTVVVKEANILTQGLERQSRQDEHRMIRTMTDRFIPADADIVSRCRAITKPGSYMLLPRANRVENVLPEFEKTLAQVLVTPSLGRVGPLHPA